MARIVLDPDEVNQAEVVTLTDGSTVEVVSADRATLGRISRQLARYHTVYADAFAPVDAETATAVARGEVALEEVAPLHLAVAARFEVVRSQPGRGAQDIDPTALLDDRRWTTSSGRAVPVEELTPSHRRNLLGWLDRHSDELEQAARVRLPAEAWLRIEAADPWVEGTPLYRRLRALDAATDSRELAMDRARQVARRIEFEATGRWPAE